MIVHKQEKKKNIQNSWHIKSSQLRVKQVLLNLRLVNHHVRVSPGIIFNQTSKLKWAFTLKILLVCLKETANVWRYPLYIVRYSTVYITKILNQVFTQMIYFPAQRFTLKHRRKGQSFFCCTQIRTRCFPSVRWYSGLHHDFTSRNACFVGLFSRNLRGQELNLFKSVKCSCQIYSLTPMVGFICFQTWKLDNYCK